MIILKRPTGSKPVFNTITRSFNLQTDLIAVRKLIHHTIEVSYSSWYSNDIIRYLKESNYNSESIVQRSVLGTIMVIQWNNSIIGAGCLMENYLFDIFISPMYQNLGLGKQLLNSLIDTATTLKKTIMVKSPLGSVNFFKNNGFKMVSEENIEISTSNYFYNLQIN